MFLSKAHESANHVTITNTGSTRIFPTYVIECTPVQRSEETVVTRKPFLTVFGAYATVFPDTGKHDQTTMGIPVTASIS